jgi:N-acyl-D-aspartate/D-glutamate deacylase
MSEIYQDELCSVSACDLPMPGARYACQLNLPNEIDVTFIDFHHGPVANGAKGLTMEALLSILIHRTTVLDARVSCDENKVALAGLEEALAAFQRRSKNNAQKSDRGVGASAFWVEENTALVEIQRNRPAIEDVGSEVFLSPTPHHPV